MKTLVFSDSHLNLPFDEKKCKLLQRIISSSDRVIINGDFWEGYQITFDQFIDSPWNRLFPLLKSKKTIYLYGNHDKKILSDGRLSLFSHQQLYQYKIKLNSKVFVFEHGNRLCPFFDDIWKITKTPLFFSIITGKLINFLVRKFRKKYTKLFYKTFNDVIRRRVEKEFTINEIVVCGHTHYAEIDLKNRLINTGFIRHGLAQYLLIDDRKIMLKEEWYNSSN